MREAILTIRENKRIARGTFRMILEGSCDKVLPGQFVNVRLEGFFLRRPISVCDCGENTITLIYKRAGRGTEEMSRMKEGGRLSVLMPLGNGFDTEKSGPAPLIIGGGAGIPPLYGLCKALAGEKKNIRVLLGFNKADEVFYEEEFKELGASVTVVTFDGSLGERGLVTELASRTDCSSFYACGPRGMLRALDSVMEKDIRGYMSLEERMGCGFGACMGCTCRTTEGPKRICREGPVFERSEIIWEQR